MVLVVLLPVQIPNLAAETQTALPVARWVPAVFQAAAVPVPRLPQFPVAVRAIMAIPKPVMLPMALLAPVALVMAAGLAL